MEEMESEEGWPAMPLHRVPCAVALVLAITALVPQPPVLARGATVGTVTALQAVQAVVRPYYLAGYSFANCSTRSPRTFPALTCPETPRLQRRLREWRGIDTGLAFCRCQSSPRTVRIWQVDNNGRVAHVDVWWNLDGGAFTDTFVVLHTRRGWLVDNEYCVGRPGTSVYLRAGQEPC